MQLHYGVANCTKLLRASSKHLNDKLPVFLDGFMCLLLLLADFGFHWHVDVHTQLFAVEHKQCQCEMLRLSTVCVRERTDVTATTAINISDSLRTGLSARALL